MRLAARLARLGTALALCAMLLACQSIAEVDPELIPGAATIRAVNIAFEPTELTVPAGVNLSIVLDNADDGIPHGLAIMEGATVIAQSEIVAGPEQTTLDLPPMGAGRYAFSCPVHPNMTGTLIVQP